MYGKIVWRTLYGIHHVTLIVLLYCFIDNSADRVGLVVIRLCKLGVSRLEREDVAGKFATPVGPFLR